MSFARDGLRHLEPPVGNERLELFIEETWGESAPRTQAKNISTLKGFFQWAVLSERLHGDPSLPIRPPKKKGAYREPFSEQEQQMILADGPDPARLHRDRCALRLLLH